MAANLNLNTKFTMGSKSETKYLQTWYLLHIYATLAEKQTFTFEQYLHQEQISSNISTLNLQ